MVDILDAYYAAKEAIFEHVGYKDDWKILPIEDSRDYFWSIDQLGRSWCKFSPKKEALEYWLADHEDEYGPYENDLYEDEIFTYCHLPKWVYRGKEFSAVCCDTRTDGNKILRIFKNDHEVVMAEKQEEGT